MQITEEQLTQAIEDLEGARELLAQVPPKSYSTKQVDGALAILRQVQQDTFTDQYMPRFQRVEQFASGPKYPDGMRLYSIRLSEAEALQIHGEGRRLTGSLIVRPQVSNVIQVSIDTRE